MTKLSKNLMLATAFSLALGIAGTAQANNQRSYDAQPDTMQRQQSWENNQYRAQQQSQYAREQARLPQQQQPMPRYERDWQPLATPASYSSAFEEDRCATLQANSKLSMYQSCIK